ncbi:putative frag1/DRAM/Sfk1 family protein [Lyophyllum shimeji]|uniref:Frag1/DRAM/Sfk1 family protein n=1 Tax=Lyophyllum shimeji TaxID=47721 RepID=A0A9P3PQG8_LYOSH|nr:putative frag1/DRAM/Sfk1 family protein [Lyophyllum shimeji]
MFSHRHQHWAYVWIPLVTSFVWFGMLWAMLITWLAQGRPKYVSQQGKIAYISDIGASFLKPLFIAGGAVTGVGFFLSLSVERLLRYTGRLPPSLRKREQVFSYLAILGSLAGAVGLICLAVFDTQRHKKLHRAFLLLFMLGVAFSAIFTIVEYHWISRDFREFQRLKIAYIAKAVITTILICLAIAFGVALYRSHNTGAILEWTVAFLFTFYLLTFYYDLRQTKHFRKHGYFKDIIRAEKQRRAEKHHTMRQI